MNISWGREMNSCRNVIGLGPTDDHPMNILVKRRRCSSDVHLGGAEMIISTREHVHLTFISGAVEMIIATRVDVHLMVISGART